MEQQPQEEPNPLMRKKKTPEELAAEAEQEELDDFTSKTFSTSPPHSIRIIEIIEAKHAHLLQLNH